MALRTTNLIFINLRLAKPLAIRPRPAVFRGHLEKLLLGLGRVFRFQDLKDIATIQADATIPTMRLHIRFGRPSAVNASLAQW